MARRHGLGKGLGALIPTEPTGDVEGTYRQVPIADIRPNRLQPRRYFDEAAMSSLAASIRAVGVLQPVLVRDQGDGGFELVAGERRWRAAKRAGLQTMPVLVETSVDDVASLEQALVENLHREDLNALEEAAAYQQLIDEFHLTHQEVAGRVGKSRAAVTNTLRLLQLPSGVQRAVADNTISAGHARALLGTPDRGLQESLVGRIVAEGLSVRAVEEIIRVRASQPKTNPSHRRWAFRKRPRRIGSIRAGRVRSRPSPVGHPSPVPPPLRARRQGCRAYPSPASWSSRSCCPPTSTPESRWRCISGTGGCRSISPPSRTSSVSIG